MANSLSNDVFPPKISLNTSNNCFSFGYNFLRSFTLSVKVFFSNAISVILLIFSSVISILVCKISRLSNSLTKLFKLPSLKLCPCSKKCPLFFRI